MKKLMQKLFKKHSPSSKDVENWRTPTTVLEVISKQELDSLQEEAISDLQTAGVLKPEALRYIRQYIDAKFDENDFDVDGRFVTKANLLDQFYSEGKAEVYSAFTDYKSQVARTIEADKRLRRAIVALDPETVIDTEISTVENDYTELKERYNQLPNKLNWEKQ